MTSALQSFCGGIGLREEVESVASSHTEILVEQLREGGKQEIRLTGDI